jgi:hypothetical protein
MTEPVDYVVVRMPSAGELGDFEAAIKELRVQREMSLRVFEVAARLHPDRLPATEIRQVLWHLGEPGGVRPGRFVTNLLQAITTADPEQRRRLRQVYSTYVDLVDITEYLLTGVIRLQALVGARLWCGCLAAVVMGTGHRPGCDG